MVGVVGHVVDHAIEHDPHEDGRGDCREQEAIAGFENPLLMVVLQDLNRSFGVAQRSGETTIVNGLYQSFDRDLLGIEYYPRLLCRKIDLCQRNT